MATKRMYFMRIEKRKGYWVSSKKYPSREQLFAAAAPHVPFGKNIKVYYEDIEVAQ